ncbi:phosphoglucosamine mutase [Paludibaculum fermentans]|uniref:Phosphoglucosamine mutase n=1 Tax=Paludibaculum fermentans TaxID=1473598 RepID=A0A7S7NQA3_PALFE|nr:phosphoglucosamine mutase [Paludibaculum fermentans]QOY87826.1 phosphoglucosamine mutase [Paludibaculum fermentans]
MSRKLFGTDGIRGVAGKPPLDEPTVFAFGAALGEWVAHHATPRVVIGMDTRESGPWLAETLAGGLAHAGAQVCFAGLTTTPGVAYLTRTEDFVAGVMISASHNPYEDNGLKAFDHSGFKLPDQEERQMEERIFAILAQNPEPKRLVQTVDPAYDRHYLDYLASTFHASLKGYRIVLDCANGAASYIGPELFRMLGADVVATGCTPDGKNINKDCGALHVDALRDRVLSEGAHFGAAFDGDADRCMLVSGTGRVIDGDHALLIAARQMRPAAVVATVMSNLGLERALEKDGLKLVRTAVGDRYVIEEMLRSGLNLGGEQSGHVIFRDYATTGDGLLTALRIFEIAAQQQRGLDELAEGFTVYPQKLVNVRFKHKRPLEELPSVQAEIQSTEAEFGDAGRVLVRFSGTEPLARVMVEGPTLERVSHRAHTIANAIEAALS